MRRSRPALLLALAFSWPAHAAAVSAEPTPAVESDPGEALFPPGPERAFLLETCEGCHTLNLVVRNGGSIDQWADRLVRMIRAGAPIPRGQIPELATYLAKAFPIRSRPEAPK